MKLLLVNDDGIQAYGIHRLAEALKDRFELTVVAPTEERSANSHGISLKAGLQYEPYDFGHGVEAYAVSGTPADCVKFALLYLKIKPDFVISGINQGANIGTDIIYSGTVAAAQEGAYLGCRAIAFSCNYHRNLELIDRAADYFAERFDAYTRFTLPEHGVLNVNYPSQPAVGEIVTRMGVQIYNDEYVLSDDEACRYQIKGFAVKHDKNDSDSDVEWQQKGYVTVTPLTMDRTDYATLEKMKRV